MTHTLTITDHPDDGGPMVSLDGGRDFGFALLVPSDTSDDQDRDALVDAVANLLGPRDQLPADLRDDPRIAWVPDAGDGEGAWCVPLGVRRRLESEGWILRYSRYLVRRPTLADRLRARAEQADAEDAALLRDAATALDWTDQNPAEPETLVTAAERIPWHEALGRIHADTGREIVGVRNTDEWGPEFTCGDWGWEEADAGALVLVEAQP